MHQVGSFFVFAIWLPTTGLAQVAGTVVDAATGDPLVEALVRIQATDLETLTDSAGEFEITSATGEVIIVAGSKGYFYDSSPTTAPVTGVSLELEAVPQEDDASYVFADPSACENCHPTQVAQWTGSPMANAGVNTWVYDIYDGTATTGGDGGFVYLNDSMHAEEMPASECRSCHQPEGWVTNPFSAMAPFDAAPSSAHNGVTCEVCHKMADIDISKPNYPGLYPGVVTMTRPSEPVFAVAYGVLGDVTYQRSDMRASYNPQLRSEVCAACHQDKNDHDLDGDFEDDGGIISEPTYLEWVESPYADPNDPLFAECVDCHMPAIDEADACNANEPSLDRPLGNVRSHLIEGTTPAFLDNAVTLTMAAEQSGADLNVEVTIDNDQTGHHVPTGVTIRNMILLVQTIDADGTVLASTGSQVVHDLGGVGDPTEGYFAGLPGKLYAKLNHDANGDGPTFFTEATGLHFDNRIPATESDTTAYTFAVPATGGDVTVNAKLIYRRSWRDLVDAKGWTEDGHGNPLEDVTAPDFGHLMETIELSMTLDPPPECTEMDPCETGFTCEDEVCVPEPAPPDDDDPPTKKGCHTAPGPAGMLLPMLLVVGIRRRSA